MIRFFCRERIVAIALFTLSLSSCDRALPPVSPTPSVSPVVETPLPPSPVSAADQAAAETLRQKGLAYRKQGQYEEAIAALQKSVDLDPNNSSGRVILGWTLHLAGQEPEAAQQLNQVLAQQPEDVPALNALGIVYLVSGDLDAAVQTHEKAVQLQPDNEIGYFNLSLAYQRLQRYTEATANAERATQLEPDNPHAWVALAIAHWSNDETAQAKDAYQRAIQLDNRYRQAAFLDHLRQAAFSQEQIQLTETIRQAS